NLRAVAYDQSALPDSNPPFITITVDHQNPHETRMINANGEPETDSTVYCDKDNSIILGAEGGTLIDSLTLPSGALANVSDLLAYSHGCSSDARYSVFYNRSTEIFRSISLASGQTNFNGGKEAQITISYPDSDQNGIVDGTSISEMDLTAAYYSNQQWIDIPSLVDPILDQVTFTTSHFSNFALLGPIPAPPYSPGGSGSSGGLQLGNCGANGSLGFCFLAIFSGIVFLRRKKR
ncbi:MAG: hypothetical protein NT056_10550, partial [Proteobacteria bacterium]|nr:hypothetical protein [Pseudomonadota bacterium]